MWNHLDPQHRSGLALESIAPPLDLIFQIRMGLESGESVRTLVHRYITRTQNPFARQIARWMLCRDQGSCRDWVFQEISSPYRRALLDIVERGLSGESIRDQIIELEDEVFYACGLEMDQRLAKIPFLMLIPLVLLMFPSLLALILGPFLGQLLSSI